MFWLDSNQQYRLFRIKRATFTYHSQYILLLITTMLSQGEGLPIPLHRTIIYNCGPRWDLNPRPRACKAHALPVWATSPLKPPQFTKTNRCINIVFHKSESVRITLILRWLNNLIRIQQSLIIHLLPFYWWLLLPWRFVDQMRIELTTVSLQGRLATLVHAGPYPIFYLISLNKSSPYYMVYRKPYKQFYTLWKTDKLSITNGLLPATSHFKTTW